jgi:simple sugar transport system permease protein
MKQKKTFGEIVSIIVHKQIFIPLAALFILVVFNFVADLIVNDGTSFFEITYGMSKEGYHVLSGNLITVIDNASELVLLAIGMTLVTAASGGQDISVGAVIAIAGSVILRIVCGDGSDANTLQAPIILAFFAACIVAMLFGAFNGMLVAYFKIQPMVATLILFTAGRSIAAWINNNELPVMNAPSFGYFGKFIPGIAIPTPVLIAVAGMILIGLVLKFTNLGLYAQSVGINPNSSRLNGINPEVIKLITYVILGFFVAIAGLIKVSRVQSINYSVIAKDIEMDAILAVALGGNPLGGGKFNIWASILGAYVIQMLTTTLFRYNVDATALPAYKAVVVVVLVVLSAPVVRERLNRFFASLKSKNEGKEAA